jgi:hypothetical protein
MSTPFEDALMSGDFDAIRRRPRHRGCDSDARGRPPDTPRVTRRSANGATSLKNFFRISRCLDASRRVKPLTGERSLTQLLAQTPAVMATCGRTIGSEGSKCRTQCNDHREGDERADNRDHNNIQITLAMVDPQTASSVTTAPLCGRLSSVPAPITATRCMSGGSMESPMASDTL